MATLKDKIAKWSSHSDLENSLSINNKLDNVPTTKAFSMESESKSSKKDNQALSSSIRIKSDSYKAKKSKLHQDLIAKFDLGSLEKLSQDELRYRIKDHVTKLLSESSLTINESERKDIVIDLQNEILGLGPLEPLLADPTISEIMVNKFDNVYVERFGRLERSLVSFDSNEHLLRIIDKIVSHVGRRIDESSPMADARLPDGSRVNAIIPPLALDGPALTIRRFSAVPLEMQDLLNKDSISPKMAEFLIALVKSKVNILISGGTGSGKTTLLNILSGYIPVDERIITIEDTAELQMQQPHVVRLETRPANIEGRGEVSMRTLVKNSLRMRPNRIVIGEVRGEEVIDMLQAMNTGHDGSLATIHANNARDALGRLENLISMSGLSMTSKAVRQQVCSALQIIIQVSRMSGGSRKITSVTELTGMEGEIITMQEIFKYQQTDVADDGAVVGTFLATGVNPKIAEHLKISGIDLTPGIFNPY